MVDFTKVKKINNPKFKKFVKVSDDSITPKKTKE